MSTRFEKLTNRVREMEDALEADLDRKRRDFRYRLDRRRVIFEDEVRARHLAARHNIARYIAHAPLRIILTAPFIYMLILPLGLLDLFVSLFHAVCFPAWRIDKVPRRDFIVIDRHRLAYLNGLQKLNCIYCGYANGLIAWVREIAARTETFWCPIKHASRVSDPHRRYHGFIDFGDASELDRKLRDQRKALRSAWDPR